MSLNNFLSQFIGGERKQAVCLSVTPGVGLELIMLDPNSTTVSQYAYKPLKYDDSLKLIVDIEEFKNAVIELFEDLNLNIKSTNIILNIPTPFFGIKELPLLLDDESVTNGLTSEVEQSYIFKRYDPVVKWKDANVQPSGELRKLFFTAIQQKAFDDIKTVFADLGANLIKIDISLMSILKALSYSKLTEAQMQDGVTWNLMLITHNGYSIVSMLGKNIIDYYEGPLPIKSYEGNEIYNAISATVQISLMNYPANYLYIVSETDLVSAEFLAAKIQVNSTVDFCENNFHKKNNLVPVDLGIVQEIADKISLEAIGIAANVEMPLDFNFVGGSEASLDDPKEPFVVMIGEQERVFPAPWLIFIGTAILCAIILSILFITYGVSKHYTNDYNKKLDEVKQSIEKLKADKAVYDKGVGTSNTFDLSAEIKKVLASNRTKLIGYTALGESVPKSLWITEFYADGNENFDIKGESENVEDIYTFYRNMKDSLINTKLQIRKLESKSSSLDDLINSSANSGSNYEFEITNMSEADFKKLEQKDAPKEEGKAEDKEPEKQPKKS